MATYSDIRYKRTRLLKNILVQVVLLVVAFIVFFPILWMISQSFTPNSEIWDWPPQFIPRNPTLENYHLLFTRQDLSIGHWFFNSLFVSTVTTVLTLLVTSLAAYSFARLRFPGRDLIFLLILGTMMIPSQVTMIPTFILMKWLGWIDTYQGLIVPRVMAPLGIFLMRQFLLTLPRELEEAARIDGCGYLRTLTQVLLPLTGPAIATLAIFTFTASWNEFFWPLIVVQSNEMWTIQLLIAAMKQAEVADWGLIMAVVTLSVLPTVVLYALLQRFFVKGIAMSGLKG